MSNSQYSYGDGCWRQSIAAKVGRTFTAHERTAASGTGRCGGAQRRTRRDSEAGADHRDESADDLPRTGGSGGRFGLAADPRPGGGRKRLSTHQPDLVARIEALIEPNVRGDPQSPLRWTTLSTRKLEAALRQDGRQISYHTVAHLLHELNYTLQGNRKGSEGTMDHPQRDAQFLYISEQASSYLRRRVPVISVDTKKRTCRSL